MLHANWQISESQETITDFSPDLCVADRRTSGATCKLPVVDRRARKRRRRLIDPTTCDRPYTHDDIEFMNAMDLYKRDCHRPFPTFHDVLEVLRALGYRKVAERRKMPGLSSTMPPKVLVGRKQRGC